MINPSDFSDRELATCVDEYFKRVFFTIHGNEEFRKEYASLVVSSNRSSAEAEFTISHKVNIGWGTGHTVESNNAIEGARTAMLRALADKASPPTVVQPLLAAPVVEEEHEEAEFTPFTESDDVSFQ